MIYINMSTGEDFPVHFPNYCKHYITHMILSDTDIKKSIERGEIVIEPFDKECLGTNSYDVHLGGTLAIYEDNVFWMLRRTIRSSI